MAELSPEYTAYLDRRYADIKQVLEAIYAHWPPEATEENHLIDTLEAEMNYLADTLGYEDIGAMLDRLVSNDEDEDDGEE
jgi:hypothetical protein